MLDWSYELLTGPEQATLRCMAVFSGSFTFQAVCAVASAAEFTASELVDIVANLVSKSLVVLDVNNGTENYRLLETTRAYAFRKLVESGELERTQRCHAEYYRVLAGESRHGGRQPADVRMVGRPRCPYRRPSTCSRLGFFSGWRHRDWRGADGCRLAVMDPPFAECGMPAACRTRSVCRRNRRRSNRAPGYAAVRRSGSYVDLHAGSWTERE